MNDQLWLGLALTILGVLIIIKSWDSGAELLRAVMLHPGRRPGALVRLAGALCAAVGIAAILVGLGIV